MAQYYHDSLYEQRPSLLQNRKLLMLIGAGILAVIIALFLLSTASNGGIKTDLARLGVRYSNLATFLGKYKDQIQNSDLHTVNATASILAQGDATQFTSIAQTDFGVQTAPDAIIQGETDSTSDGDLSNAALADHFDTTYRQIVMQKLANCQTLLNQVKSESRSSSLDAEIKTAQTNLVSIAKQFQAVQLGS